MRSEVMQTRPRTWPVPIDPLRLLSAALLVILLGSGGLPATSRAQEVPTRVLAALRNTHVYVADAARPRLSDRAQRELETYARQRAASGHALKMAALDHPPQGFRTLGKFVRAAHSALNLGDGILIAVTLDGGGSVSTKTNALNDDSIERLQRQSLGTFTTVGLPEGFRALADGVIQEIESQRKFHRILKQLALAALVSLILGLIGFWLRHRASVWKRRLLATCELRDSLYPLLHELDDDVPYLPDSEDAKTAAHEQTQGANHYGEGSKVLDELNGLSWLAPALSGRHLRRLAEAGSELSLAREHLVRAKATVGRARSREQSGPPGDPPASPSGEPEPRASLRESCFFCSRPLSPDRRLLGSIEIGGQNRTVTVCDTHAADLQAGREPLIKAVERGGPLLPWYAAAGYDPSRDYTPSYIDGFSPALLPATFIDAAFGLSYPSQQRPDRWYADDAWDGGYRSSYWYRYERWEREQAWWQGSDLAIDTPGGTAPETRFESTPSAPEIAFHEGPTAAETFFAGTLASAADRSFDLDQSVPAGFEPGSGADQS
ncbi:MAG: hypothetical protein HYZ81_15060 [Nitrospinae bacterium]|nr:hypothetical protein [Nitrospinota bacterium]